MLVSAIFVDRITCKHSIKDQYLNKLIRELGGGNTKIAGQEIPGARLAFTLQASEIFVMHKLEVKSAHTLVTPSGTGSNTSRCSSLGI